LAKIWDKIKGALLSRWGKIISIGGVVFVILGILANITGLISFADEYLFPHRKPTPTPTPTPVVVSIQSIEISSPVALGDNATVTMKTAPGAKCYINYYTPSGNLSTSQDLKSVVSGVDGTCTWEWRIANNTTPGKGRLIVFVDGIEEEHEIEIIP
jgi:hypothetical protein